MRVGGRECAGEGEGGGSEGEGGGEGGGGGESVWVRGCATIPGMGVGSVESIADGQSSSEQGRTSCRRGHGVVKGTACM